MKEFREKCEKPPFLGIVGQNGQFWTVFGQNGQNGIFVKKSFGTFFSLLKALINCKVSEKSNKGIPRKMRKPPFLGILGQNGQFWTVFGQNGQNGNFFQKAFGTFFSLLKAIINCKV